MSTKLQPTFTKSQLYPIARRAVRAQIDFLETLEQFGGLTREDAIKVFNFYKRIKVLKIGDDRISVKHGAFLDRDTIHRALAESNS